MRHFIESIGVLSIFLRSRIIGKFPPNQGTGLGKLPEIPFFNSLSDKCRDE